VISALGCYFRSSTTADGLGMLCVCPVPPQSARLSNGQQPGKPLYHGKRRGTGRICRYVRRVQSVTTHAHRSVSSKKHTYVPYKAQFRYDVADIVERQGLAAKVGIVTVTGR